MRTIGRPARRRSRNAGRQSKPITDYGATITLRPIKNWLRTAPLTGAQFAVERGQDPSVLVVAFTGFAGKLSIPTFDFLRSSELLSYSRILLATIRGPAT